MGKLSGKVAIVTGGSKGIGAGIARAYGAAGASVVVNYVSSKSGADQVVADIVAHEGKAIAIQADMSKEADVRRLVAETRKAFGRLDILVNNAGVYQFDPLEKVTASEFHREFDTNVLGPLLAIRESLDAFGPEGGSVINIGTAAIRSPMAGTVIYSATKSALDTVTRVLSVELGARKIRVNTISPGGTETEGLHRLGILGTDFAKQMIGRTPLGRFSQPDDIARVAVFFASDDSGWVTGEVLNASGGYA